MANLSTLLGGGGLQSKPVLHVQDVKDGNIGGGYVDAINTYYTRDINRIVKNTIDGATLTNDGTTSSSVGAVGTQGIVNNQSGVHVSNTWVTLPAGSYFYELSSMQGLLTNGGFTGILYDKTGAADLSYFNDYVSNDTSQNKNSNKNDGYFTLSSSSNVDVRFTWTGTLAAAADNMGTDDFGSSIKVCHLDLKIYKL